jgi:predicted Na+-dependent transporter
MKYKTEIKWAVIFFIMTLLWAVGEKLAGLYTTRIHAHAFYSSFFVMPAIVCYVLAILEKRKHVYGNSMTYLQGFSTGLLLCILVTILSPVTQAIITWVIAPEYFPNMMDYSIKIGYLSSEQARSYFSYRNYAVQGMIGAFIVGLVASAITALFTVSKNRAHGNPE